MSIDEVLMLIHAQWERGLIIPDQVCDLNLWTGLNLSVSAGMTHASAFSTSVGPGKCYSLTREGWKRIGTLMNATIHFDDGTTFTPEPA